MIEGIKRCFLQNLVSGLLVGYVTYVAAGYGTLYYSRWTIELLQFAIHPEDIEKKWGLLPFVDKVSWVILESRSPEAIQQGFLKFGLTLGAVAGGFRYHSWELTAAQRQKSRELTVLMHNKGVSTGIKFVSSGGCTALQEAIIGKDAYVAKLILEIGGKESIAGNPNAILKPCQENAFILAKEQGFKFPIPSPEGQALRRKTNP